MRKECSQLYCHSTLIAGKCPMCDRPLCNPHLDAMRDHIREEWGLLYCENNHTGATMEKNQETRMSVGEYDTQPACWLCDRQDKWVYRGLNTLGINYPGPVRFICEDCVKKIKEMS